MKRGESLRPPVGGPPSQGPSAGGLAVATGKRCAMDGGLTVAARVQLGWGLKEHVDSGWGKKNQSRLPKSNGSVGR